jgi:hypothetical protein
MVAHQISRWHAPFFRIGKDSLSGHSDVLKTVESNDVSAKHNKNGPRTERVDN